MIVESLDKQFAVLINSLKELVGKVNPEQLLRCSAVIERTFGGLTSNLWDDPFEWTLPETLSTPELVIKHLSEVDELRQRFFSSINGDEALSKLVSVPSGEPCALGELLLDTLVKASEYRGRAQNSFR